MLISLSRQMPPIDAMRNARQFAPRVKQTPSKSLLTARKTDVPASMSGNLMPIMRPTWNYKRFTCLSELLDWL